MYHLQWLSEYIHKHVHITSLLLWLYVYRNIIIPKYSLMSISAGVSETLGRSGLCRGNAGIFTSFRETTTPSLQWRGLQEPHEGLLQPSRQGLALSFNSVIKLVNTCVCLRGSEMDGVSSDLQVIMSHLSLLQEIVLLITSPRHGNKLHWLFIGNKSWKNKWCNVWY